VILTRRQWIAGAAGALAGARAAAAVPPPPLPRVLIRRSEGRDRRAALDLIRDHAAAELAATGLPGMTLALVDADGFAATINLGWADVAERVPVGDAHLFEIGSISKSLVGLWLHAAAAKGRIDLATPIARLLPDVPVPPEPITLQQLLNHVGGTAADAPLFPRVPGGRLWTGFRPGERFSYSNIGYDLLGLVIDRVAGRPHAAALDADVLAPLGMAGATAHIRTADRARFATGYVQLLSDRAALTGTALREGPWTEEDIAAGAVAATAPAMLGYLSYLVDLGRGRGGRLMPDAAARAMLAAEVAADEFGRGARYASGLATQVAGRRRLLHHTGGMLMFSSSFHVDAAAGVGCFASVNGRLDEYRPKGVTRYAVDVLRAVGEGRRLPAAPDPRAFRRIASPNRFAGRWVAATGEVLTIAREGDTLALVAADGRARLEAVGSEALATDHPRLSRHLLELDTERGSPRLWWGGTPFGRRAPTPPVVPPRRAAREGSYVARDPWGVSMSVFARGERLHADGFGELVERPGGFWSTREDAGGVDRAWFEAPIAGRPSRLCYDGYDAFRIA